MGAGVSGWQLARAVARQGRLGVVSGTALDVILARRRARSESPTSPRLPIFGRSLYFQRAVGQIPVWQCDPGRCRRAAVPMSECERFLTLLERTGFFPCVYFASC